MLMLLNQGPMVEVGLHRFKKGGSARERLGQGLEEWERHKAKELHKAGE